MKTAGGKARQVLTFKKSKNALKLSLIKTARGQARRVENGAKMFGGLNENRASFLNKKFSCAATAKKSWKNMNRSPGYKTKRETHYGKNSFWDIMAILVVVWRFLWAQMAKLSLIDF